MSDQDLQFMALALEEAKKAYARDEVPIGAILVHSKNGNIVSRNSNRTIELNDPTAHAEIMVIRDGCKIMGAQRIPEYDLYVTLEPCAMCAAAISFARINRLVFGAYDSKGGAISHGPTFFKQPTCHHRPCARGGILEDESAKILKDFFKKKR